MTDRGGRVRFQFNERISENVAGGDLASAVNVSPLTGEVRVGHSRSSLTVSLDGGFRPGLLYRVTLLPVVNDMFGNQMRDAFELVFSTGGDPLPTSTLAGEAWDRLNGRGLGGATVQAVGPDSLVHVARADDRGVFAFRYLPVGDFTVTAYQDQDRDRRLGPREASGSVPVSIAAGDTVLVEIPVLAPDSTPAIATGALALDSITVVVEFDDYLDPAAPADQIGIRLTREEGEAPLVTRLYHEVEYARYVDQVADSFARLDSIAAAQQPEPPAPDSVAAGGVPTDSVPADSVPPDVVALAGAPTRPVPVRLPGGQARPQQPGRVPPGRRLVGVLDEPLVEGTFEIRVTTVVNVNGLPGGGGDVSLQYTPPPPPPPPDSTQVGGDADDDAGADPPPAANAPAAADTLGLGL